MRAFHVVLHTSHKLLHVLPVQRLAVQALRGGKGDRQKEVGALTWPVEDSAAAFATQASQCCCRISDWHLARAVHS